MIVFKILTFTSFVIFPIISEKHEIQLDNNGYEGITVVISDKVAENAALVDQIKTAFTAASQVLYLASKNYVYFKDITIVVPKSWSSSQQYTTVFGSMSNSADFLVDTARPETGNMPYVHGLTECGGQGLYAHVTPELVLSSVAIGYGPLDKILVHEWGHLRWGLFDEYPSVEQPDVDEKFYNEDGTWKPIMCTDKILGVNLRDCSNPRSRCFTDPDGKPDTDCQFCVQTPNNAQASLMAYQWISSVVEFCDEDTASVDRSLRHNARAPNDQNRHCNQQSAWQVMRTHTDFKVPNTAGSATRDTTPVFTVIQEGDLRLSLVLDISSSMNSHIVGPTRLQLLQDTVSHFITYVVPDNTDVGIVTFSTRAAIVTGMTKVTSDAIRQSLVQDLPINASGYTAIGDGLLKGIEVMNTTGNIRGCLILLVTDGTENRHPLVADVLPTLVAAGVTVHSLAISSQSDNQLTNISDSTGGKSFYYSESVDSTILQDAFLEMIADSDPSVQQLHSQSLNVQGGSPVTGQFYVDSTVGVRTVLQVLVNDMSSNVSVQVSGPDGTVYTSTSGPSANSVDRHVAIDGTAPPGRYSYTITSATDLQGTMQVQSGRTDSSSDGIRVYTWTSERQYSYGATSTFRVFASVLRNKSPVLKTSVMAALENENGVTVTVALNDNGVGSDLTADDGLYSGTILPKHVTLDGRLSVKVMVSSTDGTAKVRMATPGAGAAPLSGTNNANTVSLGTMENFQRVSLTGEVVVQNYVPGAISDVIPPAKITTLTLTSVDVTSGVVHVTWKAVGDDIDDGTASMYDVRLSTSINNLMTNPEGATRLTSQVPSPKTSGKTETFTFTIPDQTLDNRTYYLSVRSVDDSSNVGDLSNIVSVSIVTDSNWLPTTAMATTVSPRPYSSDQSALIGLSISAGVVLIGLIIVGVSICCGRCRRASSSSRHHLGDMETKYSSQSSRIRSHSRQNSKSSSRQINERKHYKRSRHTQNGMGVYALPEPNTYGNIPYFSNGAFYSSDVLPYAMYEYQ